MSEPQSRIELTCILLPDEHDEVDLERKVETLVEWHRAGKIASKFGALTNTQYHHENDTEYGDAYLYPSLETLERVLTELENSGVGFDNIDLPENAPLDLVARIKKNYDRPGIMVNEGAYP